MKHKQIAIAYAAALTSFLSLDAVWLKLSDERLYRQSIGHLMREGFDGWAALAFYAIYIGGVVFFAVMPGLAVRRCKTAFARGALLGWVAYATYDLTNQATLNGWPWRVTVIDMVWGLLVTGSASALACRYVLMLNDGSRRR